MLTEVCHDHYLRRSEDDGFVHALVAGRFHTDSPNFYEDVCRVLDKPDSGSVIACIESPTYGFFFAVSEGERKAFTAWARGEWSAIERQKSPGWPVIRVALGEWPIDARLLPGTPLALPCLESSDGQAPRTMLRAYAALERGGMSAEDADTLRQLVDRWGSGDRLASEEFAQAEMILKTRQTTH